MQFFQTKSDVIGSPRQPHKKNYLWSSDFIVYCHFGTSYCSFISLFVQRMETRANQRFISNKMDTRRKTWWSSVWNMFQATMMSSELRVKDGGWLAWGRSRRKIGKDDTLDSPGFFWKRATKYPGAEGDGTTKLRGTLKGWGLDLGFRLIFWSWSIFNKKGFAEKKSEVKHYEKTI